MATNKKSGFFNGLGYLGEKIGAGFMQSVEGIWDFAAGGLADVFGADEWAKKQMSNDWFGNWYNTAGDWFDAKGGWKTAGDVAGGIGTTLPAIVAAVGGGVATALTGGATAPLAVKAIAISIAPLTAGLGAAGTSTKEAYQKTGELTGKEYGYGALSGALEAGIEAVTGGIGTGSARIAKSAFKGATKTAAQEAAEAVAKKSVKDIAWKAAKRAGADFVSEGVEEGLTEMISPYLQRFTYDPSAENATPEEIAYAAVIGGLAGAVLGSTGSMIGAGVNTISDAREGAKAIEAGQEQEILALAKDISEQIGSGEAGYEVLSAVKVVYDRLVASISSGNVTTLQQKADLGKLKKLLSVTPVLPTVELSAMGLVSNPEAAIAKYSQLGITDENGNPITVEKLTEGLEFDENGRASVSSLRKAISQNRVLGTLAIAEATGRLMVDHNTYLSNATTGGYLGGRAQYQDFVENASPEQKAAMANLVGAENLDAVDYETFAKRMIEYGNSTEGSAKIRSARDIRNRAENIPENEKAIPPAVSAAMDDGVHRFGGKEGIAIFKNGDTVRIYDYETRNTTRELTIEEASAELRKARRALPETKPNETTTKSDETTTKPKKTTDDIDAYAKENVKGYEDLLPAERREIRAMIRQAKALGIPDADIKTYARVSARSGVRVVFSKDRCAVTYKDGTEGFADGYYDPKTNEIVVNPDGKRSPTKLLVHELSHALYSYKKYRTILDREVKNMDKERANDVAARYRNAGESVEVTSEELAVHHAEDVLGHKSTLERVMMEEPNIKSKILSFFRVAKSAYQGDERLSRAAGRLYDRFEKAFKDFADANRVRLSEEISEARMRGDDARFSLQFADNIADNQRSYLDSHKKYITDDELTKAIDDTAEMVKAMLPHKDILPTDVTGKKGSTLVKNGSYDVSVENTTVCIRTLAYNAFTDMVSEKIGRPLSQMESFLVSQKLYDIAKEPQCLYCYVSLDRKAFNEMIIRYVEQRDAAVKAWKDAGKPEVKLPKIVDGKVVGDHPYKDFLDGRKHTDNMWKRYSSWIEAAKNGEKAITLKDVATESRRAEIAKNGTTSQKAQIADMLKYAQSASWAKKQTQYVAYYDDILRLSPKAVADLNKHYGLRWYSFSDYSGAFIVENMQQITDASLRGLKGLSYTKDVDFARIFAPTGMNINISVYATDVNGKWEIDAKQSADIEAAIKLREEYPNVGIVVVATKKEGVDWALAQEWSDVVIPFHIVRSGQDVANFYDWEVFNAEQGDTVADENLWSQYVESLGNPKKVSKNIYPSEHQNNRETYLDLCKSRGIKPRFSSFLDNPNYMKLVNETRQAEADTSPLKPKFDLDAAKTSFDKFVKKGGYYEGWYNDGIDVNSEVDTVAADVLAGKKANEVEYGRQDRNGNAIPTPDEIMASRKSSRGHKRMALPNVDTYTEKEYNDYGWARANDILTESENNHYREQFAAARKLKHKYRKTPYGELMIPVEDSDRFGWKGAYSKVVFAKGTIERPIITRVLIIALTDTKQIEKARDTLYDFERRGIQQTTGELFIRYDASDVESFQEYQRRRTESDGDGIGHGSDRRATGSYDETTAWRERLLSQGYYEEGGYMYAPDGSKTSFFFPDDNRRRALPDTTESVGKSKTQYTPKLGDKIFTAKTRTYIETVDELYGIETYLRKVGKMKKDKVDARVQMARSARSQAQTMIGSAQYNVFSDKPEKMGDGLLEIYKPTRLWSAEKRKRFDDYLLHCLNIDRMTLESRSKVWTANERAAIQKVKLDIDTLNARQKTLRADIKKGDTAIVNARVKKGTAKTAAAKANWQTKVDALTKQMATDIADLKKTERDIKKKIAEFKKLQQELKALELKNKPVFGKDETLDENGNMKRDHDITAAESKKIVADYEKSSPEFKEIAKKLYTYLDNLQTMRVEAGLITREQADYMKKLYPHYVPSYRDTEGGGVSIVKGKNNLEISTTLKKAKGGNQDILEVASSIAQQTSELMKAGQINILAGAIYDAAKESGDNTYVEIISEEDIESDDNGDAILRPKQGQVTFHRDGKRITMQVSREILLGFDGLRNPSVDFSNPLMQAFAKMNTLFKRGVTSLNPAFMLRNPIRDLQDAGLNSKHPILFSKALASAAKDIATNSKEWELYRALGGFSSTVFEGTLATKGGRRGFESIAALFDTDAEGFAKVWDKAKATAKSPITAVENANAFLEQITRFAEFKASLDAGDSPSVALNNAAEVTTNFGRRGRTAKTLNATLMPFLNPAIQGFDKIFRNVGDAFTSGQWVRGLATLLTKAALIGVVPMLLNSIMYDDDEDYEKLRETDKENYFLIKIGDGNFIKIPRGRLASVIGGAYNRSAKLAKGEDADIKGYLKNAKTQVTPVENISRTIFSPIFDVMNNKTWYGGEIEGREWDDTAPRDRYDESTSSIAVTIGQVLNVSPKKVHYLLDQYSGVIGDFLLPATTQKEHKGFFSGNFTLDSVTSNKLSEKFYDLVEHTQYAKTAGDADAAYRLDYLNRVKKSVKTMNEEIDSIRNSDKANAEKMQEVRIIRALINAEYDSALKSIDVLNAAITETAEIEDEVIRSAEIDRLVFGTETALKNYNAKTYEKYQLFNGVGIGYDELYVFHFATLGLENDTDKKGNVIEGSKRKKIVAIVNALNIPTEQKVMLLASKGYAVRDGEIRGVTARSAKTMLQRYIVKSNLSKADKEALAKACGFTVKNGVIVNK